MLERTLSFSIWFLVLCIWATGCGYFRPNPYGHRSFQGVAFISRGSDTSYYHDKNGRAYVELNSLRGTRSNLILFGESNGKLDPMNGLALALSSLRSWGSKLLPRQMHQVLRTLQCGQNVLSYVESVSGHTGFLGGVIQLRGRYICTAASFSVQGGQSTNGAIIVPKAIVAFIANIHPTSNLSGAFFKAKVAPLLSVQIPADWEVQSLKGRLARLELTCKPYPTVAGITWREEHQSSLPLQAFESLVKKLRRSRSKISWSPLAWTDEGKGPLACYFWGRLPNGDLLFEAFSPSHSGLCEVIVTGASRFAIRLTAGIILKSLSIKANI